MDEVKEQKCTRCKVLLPIHKFSKKRDEKYFKTCNDCKAKQKISREKNKCEHGKIRCRCVECGGASICEHGRRRSVCKECGGSEICEHGRERTRCKECGGSYICEHNRERSTCKECGGASICEHNRQRNSCKKCTDPIKITINNWIAHSKHYDKKTNRYDANNFIDKCFLEGLVEDYPNCFYCNIILQYVEYQDDLATIERVDNNIGHTKANCVIACKSCNLSHQD